MPNTENSTPPPGHGPRTLADAIEKAPTVKPWPHGWREGMRLVAVPDMKPRPWPVLLVMATPHEDYLYCVEAGGLSGGTFGADPSDPRTQPDLEDDGTLGHLKGMVQALLGEPYALQDDAEDGGWFEPVTGRTFAYDGRAYVAALDHLAAKAPRSIAGIRITSATPDGIHDGALRLKVTADTSELTGALATIEEKLRAVGDALEAMPDELQRDSEIVVRIDGDVWAAGEGRMIANMVEDYGRLTVQRHSGEVARG